MMQDAHFSGYSRFHQNHWMNCWLMPPTVAPWSLCCRQRWGCSPPPCLPTHIHPLQFICASSVSRLSVPGLANQRERLGTKGRELGPRSERRIKAFGGGKDKEKPHLHQRPTPFSRPRRDNNGNQVKSAFYVASQSGTCDLILQARERKELREVSPFMVLQSKDWLARTLRGGEINSNDLSESHEWTKERHPIHLDV